MYRKKSSGKSTSIGLKPKLEFDNKLENGSNKRKVQTKNDETHAQHSQEPSVKLAKLESSDSTTQHSSTSLKSTTQEAKSSLALASNTTNNFTVDDTEV